MNYIEKEKIVLIDFDRLAKEVIRFTAFVQHMDGHKGKISFRDNNGFLGREEDYKSHIAETARQELNLNSWKKSWIGTGKIADCAKKAMNKSGNLVDQHQRIDFVKKLDSKSKEYQPKAEEVLYDIYVNPLCNESKAFNEAKEVFGGYYDTLAFLFFIKDDTRFLPIRTEHFDKAFSILDIDYTTSRKCSWDNYQGFINKIKQIRKELEDTLPMDGIPRLIDAHSFLWIIQEDKFIEWKPDEEEQVEMEEQIENISGSGGLRRNNSYIYNRSNEVARETKRRANGICQLCNQKAPFIDKNGEPYLEAHHIVWLSRGGEDSTTNTVALCPNCHKKMHHLDLKEDVDKLLLVCSSFNKKDN